MGYFRAMPRTRINHRFVDGKPVGLQTTVEERDYIGTDGGKPIYSPSQLDRWKTAAVLLGIACLILLLMYLRH